MTATTLTAVAALVTLSPVARTQPPARTDSATIVFAARNNAAGSWARPNEGEPIANLQVFFQDGEVGRTNDSGYVTIRSLPAKRIAFVFRGPKDAPLTCRLTPRVDRVDTVDVIVMQHQKVAVWSSPGCRPRQ